MTMNAQFVSSSLYVGDLNSDVSEGLLAEIFGTVSPGTNPIVRVCRDETTKQSLGYAYVNYSDHDLAEKALNSLNHTVIKGRPCRIMWQQRDPSKRRQGKGNVYISNLQKNIGNKELHDTFTQFGTISSCKVVVDVETGLSKGYGYVHFESEDDADEAIKVVNGRDIRGLHVYATHFVPRQERVKKRENSWTNVFVKNIPDSITEDEILQVFRKYGEITSHLFKDKHFANGELKKMGFINYKNHDDAVNAVKELDKSDVGGFFIECCRHQKRQERSSHLRRVGQVKNREKINQYYGRNLYIKNIEDHITDEILRTEFEQFGPITSLKISRDENGASKGFGFVCFETKEQAARAIDNTTQRTLPQGNKPLYVTLHEPKEMRRQKFASRARRGNPLYQQMFQSYPYPPPNLMGWQASPNQMGPGPARRANLPPNMMPPQNRMPIQQQNPGLPPLDVLLSKPEKDRRDLLGITLYSKIEQMAGSDQASKITGMFLEWDPKEIYELLLMNENYFETAVKEAINLLKSSTNVN
jgi:polyadenylate-binding protein